MDEGGKVWVKVVKVEGMGEGGKVWVKVERCG